MPSTALPRRRFQRPIRFFVRGQVALLVEHPRNLPADEIVRRVQDMAFLRDDLVQKTLQGAKIDPRRVQTFQHTYSPAGLSPDPQPRTRRRDDQQAEGGPYLPDNRPGQAFDDSLSIYRRATQPAFSLVFVDLAYGTQSKPEIVALVDRINGLLIRRIDQQGHIREQELTLRGATPNWLSTPSPEDAGGGGPGARPAQDNQFDDYQFALPPFDGLPAGDQLLTDVEVAILDTVPHYDIHNLPQPWAATHPLLTALRDPSNPLQVIPASALPVTLPTPLQIVVKHHDYRMSDHGLFAAGIVRTIAPHANIRLIEVLNDHGVGTLESIAKGLLLLANERKNKPQRLPLLVNLSLTIVMPLQGQPVDGLAKDWPLFATQPIDINRPELQLLGLSLEWACAALRRENTLIVAAAGNDAGDPDGNPPGKAPPVERPQARYPAAFPTVLGVGSLEEGSTQPADYSNWSDAPQGIGVATFGGARQGKKAKSKKAILGVYIGDLPADEDPNDPLRTAAPTIPNTSGWAWWAGTSFAAPIITAVLAKLAGHTGALEPAETILEHSLTPPPADGIGGCLVVSQGS